MSSTRVPGQRLEPRKLPKQARSQVTVDAILQAAAQVFERHGYAAGTTNRIAARAGVSIGTVYQYFPNKDAIMVALIHRHLAAGSQILAPLLAAFLERPPPVARGLEQLVAAMVGLHRHQPRLHRVLFEECPRPPGLQHELNQTRRAAAAAVTRWLDSRPEVGVSDTRVAADLVVQVLEGVTHGLAIHPAPDFDPDTYANETVELLTRYLLVSL